MMKKVKLPPICLILSSKEFPEKAKLALSAGIKWIQFRDKEISRRETLYLSFKLRELTKKYNAILTINDYLDIAIAVEAEGVHLGQDDFPIKEAKKFFSGLIGLSTHSLDEALRAEKGEVDYIGFGPVFKTTTKKNALEPRGFSMLSLIRKNVKLPVVAIGGINLDNVEKIIESGCRNIAVSSGILSGDMVKNIEKFIKIFKEE